MPSILKRSLGSKNFMTEHSRPRRETLAAIWNTSAEEATTKPLELVGLSFFAGRGSRQEPSFWVPFLYRDALKLVQGSAD